MLQTHPVYLHGSLHRSLHLSAQRPKSGSRGVGGMTFAAKAENGDIARCASALRADAGKLAQRAVFACRAPNWRQNAPFWSQNAPTWLIFRVTL